MIQKYAILIWFLRGSKTLAQVLGHPPNHYQAQARVIFMAPGIRCACVTQLNASGSAARQTALETSKLLHAYSTSATREE